MPSVGRCKSPQPLEKPDNNKFKYFVVESENGVIHKNHYDSSFVAYYAETDKGVFDVVFDQRLYEAPRIVLDLEKQMAEEAAKAKQ